MTEKICRNCKHYHKFTTLSGEVKEGKLKGREASFGDCPEIMKKVTAHNPGRRNGQDWRSNPIN